MNEPEPIAEPPPPPVPEITLEEWIAATQACCGVDHDDAPEPGPIGSGLSLENS
jgi:hypothetical protein